MTSTITMITPKQRRFLEMLHQHLKEHAEHTFVLRGRGPHEPGRLVLSFPYGSGIKNEMDKDHRNFDYKIDALFNKKLREAMQIVVYFNSLFPEATEMTKELVVREMQRRTGREKSQ
jgi:hypothetical protein